MQQGEGSKKHLYIFCFSKRPGHSLDLIFMSRIDQHHSRHLTGVQAGELADENASQGMSHQKIGFFFSGLLQSSMKLDGDRLWGMRLRPAVLHPRPSRSYEQTRAEAERAGCTSRQ